MIKVKVTNPYHHEIFTVDDDFKTFKDVFYNNVNAVGFVLFEDTSGAFITISPDKFASVEIYEEER